MKGKNIFTSAEINQLVDLINLRNETPSSRQKTIRDKIRGVGFYGKDDWGITNMQVADLHSLISSGKIKVIGNDFLKKAIQVSIFKQPSDQYGKTKNKVDLSTDLNIILKGFMSNPYDPSVDSDLKVGDSKGNYILCLRRNSTLPNCSIKPAYRLFDGLEVLYTGIASISLRTRDIKQHFLGNNAGQSTIRKSLGVIWGFKQIPRDKDPNTGKTKFNLNDELRLSTWMKSNIIMYTLPTTDYEKIEIILINHFNPPLNLKGNKNVINKDFRQLLSTLRRNNQA